MAEKVGPNSHGLVRTYCRPKARQRRAEHQATIDAADHATKSSAGILRQAVRSSFSLSLESSRVRPCEKARPTAVKSRKNRIRNACTGA